MNVDMDLCTTLFLFTLNDDDIQTRLGPGLGSGFLFFVVVTAFIVAVVVLACFLALSLGSRSQYSG